MAEFYVPGAIDRANRVIERRVYRAPAGVRQGAYGTSQLSHRVWLSNDRALVSVDKISAIDAAERRSRKQGDPYPHLIGSQHAMIEIPEKARFSSAEAMTLDVGPGSAFRAGPDSCFHVSNVRIVYISRTTGRTEYDIPGAVYVVRYGTWTDASNFAEVLDDMVVKHLDRSGRAHP